MPAAQDPGAFTDEELLALLKDATVSTQAIAEEMDGAGVKPHPEEELRLTRELLDGFAPDRVADVSRVNAELRDLLLSAAVEAKAGGFVAALAACADKSIAKLGKKGIHVLRTRGITVEPQKPSTAPVVPAAAAAEEFPPLMSLPSHAGVREIYIPYCVRGGIDLARAQVSDTEGILAADVHPFTRKEFRRFLGQLDNLSFAFVEVPLDYARGLVLSSLDLNARARRAVPSGFNDVAFLIGGDAPRKPSPGRRVQLSIDDAELDSLVGRGAELYRDPQVALWAAPLASVNALMDRKDEIKASPIYLDDLQRQESIRAASEQAARDWFTEERRALLAERLYDAVLFFQKRSDQQGMRVAAVTARALESDRDVATIPFALAYLDLDVRQKADDVVNEHVGPTAAGLVLPQ